MSSNFFSLPREIRDQIYELVLVDQEPIDCLRNLDTRKTRPHLATQLLRVNKAVSLEATSRFYSQNHFFLTWGTSEQVASFLKQIGQRNASFIQHVQINFPEIHYLRPGEVTLDSVGVNIIASIQSSCANITTLTTSLYRERAMYANLAKQTDPKVVTEALELVNTHFRTIFSLEEIFIEMFQTDLDDHIRKEIESYGWRIILLNI